MHHLCGLCSAFIERCTFRYAELYQARPEGVDLSDPSHLADDFVHHANYPALCASALQGCHICVFLRILIERGHPYELGRYTAAARETSLPIKLSQESHGEWRYDETRGDCIHIRVPCGPTKIGRLVGKCDVRPQQFTMLYSRGRSKPASHHGTASLCLSQTFPIA